MNALFQTITKDDLVLVTGGTGTLGTALLPALLATGCLVRVLSRDETKQAILAARHRGAVDWRLGDVRNMHTCADAVRDATVIIHAASLKYVDLGEQQPAEYVWTNVQGTLNMVNAALAQGSVRSVIGISSDKACQPVNVYGMTKAMLERLFVEAHVRKGSLPVRFTVCRYGNVIGSRGSVVLKWQEAKARGERIKVTDPQMTRFFFTIDDAIRLISTALEQPEGGTVVMQRMPSCDLGTLASLWGGYDVVGVRPGEKLHEALLSPQEAERTWPSPDGVMIYTPLSKPREPGVSVRREWFMGYDSLGARRIKTDDLRVLTEQWR